MRDRPGRDPRLTCGSGFQPRSAPDLWERLPAANRSPLGNSQLLTPGRAAGWLLALNFARHPWRAQIGPHWLWRPASLSSARRASNHPTPRPSSSTGQHALPAAPGGRRARCLLTIVARSPASHEGEEHAGRGPPKGDRIVAAGIRSHNQVVAAMAAFRSCAQTSVSQPWESGACPYWMLCKALRSFSVLGPGLPSSTVISSPL